MDKIKEQASKVGQLVFASETGATYQKTLVLTWNILRETAQLLWLVICLIFVGAEWFWKTATGLGRKARAWSDSLSQASTEEMSLSSMGESVVSAGKHSAAFLLYRAKQQLGIDAEPPKPAESKSKPVAAPPAAEPVPVVAPPPPAAADTKPAIASAAEAVELEPDDDTDDQLEDV